eukprot:9481024-Pyramimonas_sp.AAC.1
MPSAAPVLTAPGLSFQRRERRKVPGGGPTRGPTPLPRRLTPGSRRNHQRGPNQPPQVRVGPTAL